MQFGTFEIRTFVERDFRLDGGSMFGVVPKSLWGKLIAADEQNLIPMRTNLFVLKAHGKTMLFDAGFGDTLSDRERKIYSLGDGGGPGIEAGLASLGLTTDDIDVVILTHLHTDHAAGAVRLEDGEFVPRFANATYITSATEFFAATNPDERTAAVYIPERYSALKRTGRLELIDGDLELFPGIRAVRTGGHTAGHFALEIESGGRKVWYYADIFCTVHHLRVAYVPATDLYPLETMRIKRAKLPQILDEQVVMAFDHDVDHPLATFRREGKSLVAAPVL